jgi:monovalent cation:H+ antiporter-2, CPA2 family
MSAEGTFYRDLAYVFGAAVLGGGVARLLRQPMILGYVLGGILIGPFTPGVKVSDVHEFELLAEIGVILLMYSLGLEFSFRDLLQVKWVAIIGGPLGILLSVALGLGVGTLLGWTWQQGIAVGAIISVASTMVLSRFLVEGGQLQLEHGQIMIGITLVEDLVVVLLTILLPSLGNLRPGTFLVLAIAMGKAILILTPVIFIAHKLVPPLMRRVLKAANPEFFVLVALALGFLTAALTHALGLSLALGAFLAGLLVSESEAAHQTMQHLLPLRDAFVALFFVTMGILVNPRILISQPSLLVVIVVLVVVGKLAVWTVVVKLFRYPIGTALKVGIGLTQIGEFSYVLVRVARDGHIVGDDLYNATLAASIITILINGLLIGLAPGSLPRTVSQGKVPQAKDGSGPGAKGPCRP